MEYRAIRGTGLKVSRMCLGTMMFGAQTSREESVRIIRAALDKGVNFFDTADIYNRGASEELVGEALEGARRDAVIATKVGGPAWFGPGGMGLGRAHVMAGVEDSLRRLRTDHIDIYYYHIPDHTTPPEEMIETMDILVRQGKIRYWGVSNFAAWEIARFIDKAREMGCVAPVITQSVYNLLTRGADEELLPFIREYKIGLAPFNPLAGGLLTGKHTRDAAAAGSRMADDKGYRLRYWKERNFDAMDELGKIADEAGMSLLELAVRWVVSVPEVSAPIIGVSRLEQLEQNAALVEKGELDAELMKKCDAAWSMIKGDWFDYHR
jgi:aryl-alcohol dehydrogenase (NADP+)